MHINQLPKHTTLASLRAALDARKPYTDAISAAIRAGDLEACEAAQKAMREAFPNGWDKWSSAAPRAKRVCK